jgi:Tfp pilus assembly protein PilX
MNWRQHNNFPWPNCAENGMVLLLGLAILAGLSLLALLAANSMLHQQQMAANLADNELARSSSRYAVDYGERFLMALPGSTRKENCLSDCFVEDLDYAIHPEGHFPESPEYQTDHWWLQWASAHEKLPLTSWSLPGRMPPQFLIEELKFQPVDLFQASTDTPVINGVGYYRVMGRGTGKGQHTTRLAESIFARPWRAVDDATGADCAAYRDWFDCGRMAYREIR